MSKPKRPDNHRPLVYVLIKKFGIRGACRILREDVFFDIKNRVNTAAPVSRRRLYPRGQQANQNRYVASTFGVVEATVNFAATHFNIDKCGFVDLGSGKGKALIAAERFPFQSLRGVEVSLRMYNIAMSNIFKLGLQSRIEFECSSATNFALRPHERVLYLFNPFIGNVLEQCLDNISRIQRDGPGILIYVNPTEAQQVESHFDLIETVFLQPGSCEVKYYYIP